MGSTNLIKHRYNRNKIDIGDTVSVDTGRKYLAVVEGLRLDSKNKKIFAYLKVFNSARPSRVDVSDCKQFKNII